MRDGFAEYTYTNAHLGCAHRYLLPPLFKLIDAAARGGKSRIFEIGAGNGAIPNALASQGHEINGIEYSLSGVESARRAFPCLRIEQGSAYDDLRTRYGQFHVVLSVEVVEHLYVPRLFAQRCFEILQPGGTLVVSTPYHGYWENLALAVTGKLDAHFTALWDGGHIKFWSVKTLRHLLEEAGLRRRRIHARRPDQAPREVNDCGGETPVSLFSLIRYVTRHPLVLAFGFAPARYDVLSRSVETLPVDTWNREGGNTLYVRDISECRDRTRRAGRYTLVNRAI